MADHPTFGAVDYAPSAAALDLKAVGEAGEISDTPFQNAIKDFYQTNPIARASVTMAECSALAGGAAARIAAE